MSSAPKSMACSSVSSVKSRARKILLTSLSSSPTKSPTLSHSSAYAQGYLSSSHPVTSQIFINSHGSLNPLLLLQYFSKTFQRNRTDPVCRIRGQSAEPFPVPFPSNCTAPDGGSPTTAFRSKILCLYTCLCAQFF